MSLPSRAGVLRPAMAVLLLASSALAQNIASIAGSGSPGLSGDNAAALAARIDTVYGVAVDAQGSVYLADSRNHSVRKVSGGTITTVAGTGTEGNGPDGGPATSAQLSFPRAVAVDAQGNLYIADTGNCRIRKVTPTGTISTIAGDGTANYSGDGGPASAAQLSYPEALAVDSAGNLYVADSWNYRIRKISTGGTISLMAGNGSYGPFGDGAPATAASLGLIESLAIDTAGNLYLSDAYNHLIRKVVPGGNISTVVGGGFGPAVDGGTALAATLKFPKGIAADALGNLYIADSMNDRIRRVSPGGIVSTLAGTGVAGYSGDGGAAATAQLNGPFGLAEGPTGGLVFSDLANYRVRVVGGGTPVPPTIRGVVSTADGQLAIVPGAYVSIYGDNLASVTLDWTASITNGQLPTEVGGVSVTVAGKPAYIQYVTSTQINILAPALTAGAAPVVVTNGSLSSAPFASTAQVYAPEFFLWGQYAVATHLDWSYCAKAGMWSGVTSVPAKPGEWITLWGSGFGPTAAPLGSLTPSTQLYMSGPVTATVGGANATVYDNAAAMAPGFAGLYQLTIQIPASAADGDALVNATIGGVRSPGGVYLTVKH